MVDSMNVRVPDMPEESESPITPQIYAKLNKILCVQIDIVSNNTAWFFSERELMFMFVICRRPSVCRLSETFVHPTQPIEIFGNVSAPFNTLVTWPHPGKILRRSSQGNPSDGGLNQRVVEKCSDLAPFRGYISETVQNRR